jgi:glycosyltransferase involved in cell wall biosynthesis
MKTIEAPQVSVIIPVWNRGKKLSKCLESVLDQTFTDYEVVVVDNASTDGTKSVIDEFARRNSKVKYLHEPKRGIGSARYKGEIFSKGKVILMTDSDCEVPPDWIEKMSSPVLEGKFSALQGMKHEISDNYWAKNMQHEEHRIMLSFFEHTGTSTIDTANFCVDRSVLEKVGYTDKNIQRLNDTELAARFLKKGYKIELVETSVGHTFPTSPFKMAKILFFRASVHSRLSKRYPGNPIFGQETFRLFWSYLLGLASELIRMRKTFPYDLVTGISWRLGFLWGSMKKTK